MVTVVLAALTTTPLAIASVAHSASGIDTEVSSGLPKTVSTKVSWVGGGADGLRARGVTHLGPPEGFGGRTSGGAGGTVYRVTSHEDAVRKPAPGTLRWATSQPGPRWIVFDRPMTIDLAAPLPIRSDTTLDGRGSSVVITGPGHSGLLIHDVENVIVVNLTLRDFGDTSRTNNNDPGDAIHIARSSRVWIHGNSLSRAGDKLIGANDGVREVTISWNHFFEQKQTLQLGTMSTATRDVENTVTIHHNWFERVGYRMPVVSYGKAHIYNNYMDRWGTYAVRSQRLAQVYLEKNVFRADARPKATITRPSGNGCNDRGSLCDDREGRLADIDNLYLGRVKTQESDPRTVFAPTDAYRYSAATADDDLQAAIQRGAGARGGEGTGPGPGQESGTARPKSDEPGAGGAETRPPDPRAPRTRAVQLRTRASRGRADRLLVRTQTTRDAARLTRGKVRLVVQSRTRRGWVKRRVVRLGPRDARLIWVKDRNRNRVTAYRVRIRGGAGTAFESPVRRVR